MKKSILAGTVATVVGGLVLMVLQNYIWGNKANAQPYVTSSLSESVSIRLMGSNNDLVISNGGSIGASARVDVSGSNLSRELSVGEHQTVDLKIVGSNNDIKIAGSVFSRVSVDEVGSNNSVTKTLW